MRQKQKPILTHSSMTGTWYLCLTYKDLGEGRIEAHKKIDITEELRRFGLIV